MTEVGENWSEGEKSETYTRCNNFPEKSANNEIYLAIRRWRLIRAHRADSCKIKIMMGIGTPPLHTLIYQDFPVLPRMKYRRRLPFLRTNWALTKSCAISYRNSVQKVGPRRRPTRNWAEVWFKSQSGSGSIEPDRARCGFPLSPLIRQDRWTGQLMPGVAVPPEIINWKSEISTMAPDKNNNFRYSWEKCKKTLREQNRRISWIMPRT